MPHSIEEEPLPEDAASAAHHNADYDINSESTSTNDVPSAPYPPMMSSRFPSTQLSSIRSSLSTSPAYAFPAFAHRDSVATSITTTAGSTEDRTAASSEERFYKHHHAPSLPKLQFCHYDMLATINCPLETDTTVANSRKAGPVLLQLRQILFQPHGDKLFANKVVCTSRGNPSLGTSVTSTCIDVSKPLSTAAIASQRATSLCHGLDHRRCVQTFLFHTNQSQQQQQQQQRNNLVYRVLSHQPQSPSCHRRRLASQTITTIRRRLDGPSQWPDGTTSRRCRCSQ